MQARPRRPLLGLLSVVLLLLGCGFLLLVLLNTPRSADQLSSANSDPTASSNTPTFTATATAAPTYTPPPTRTPTPTETPLPPTATPAFTATPTQTLPPSVPTPTPSITPTRRPTNTPLPSGRSALELHEMPSDALVAQLNPAGPLPEEISDCRWVQQGGPRVACKYQIFLPPGYFDGTRRYPVVYLLHGWGGWDTRTSNNEYNWYGTFALADEMMRGGEIPPFIIVVPEGDRAYWFNHAGGGSRWGDYVALELVPFIDANYRTLARRDARAIGGLSMGGLGAMQLALNHPDLFATVGMRSPTLRHPGDPDVPDFFGDAAYYRQYDPMALITRYDRSRPLTVFIIIGEQDIWLGRTTEFRALLDQQQVAYEWRVYPGEHDATFFGSRLDEELSFYGKQLATR